MINAIINHAGKEIEVNITVKRQTACLNKTTSLPVSLLLAKINIDLFTSLYTWGASQEKICHALQINNNEFDLLQGLISA